jgi:hypothetical protein
MTRRDLPWLLLLLLLQLRLLRLSQKKIWWGSIPSRLLYLLEDHIHADGSQTLLLQTL